MLTPYQCIKLTIPLEPTSSVEKYILGLVCVKAASDLATQRGREYGFGPQVDVSGRATSLHTLDPAKLRFLPKNNLDCERDLAIFDKLAARSASCSNHKFTAKGIRDEMTVIKCSPVSVEKVTKSLVKILDEHEKQWVEKQNILTRDKLEKSCRAALKAVEYVHVLLQKCKSWGGPFTKIEELEECVSATDNDDKLILRNEVAYRKHSSVHDQKARPQLYRLNQVTTAELKINLTIILTSDTDIQHETLPNMPTEEDMERVFNLNGLGIEIPDTAPTEQSGSTVQKKRT